jgi:hypothetical protein
MNKGKQCLWYRMRLRPVPRRLNGYTELPLIDDDWIVRRVDGERGVVELHGVRLPYALCRQAWLGSHSPL